MASIAPFYCISCDRIGFILCPSCRASALTQPPSRCYRCHKATTQFQVCTSCRSSTPLRHVWVVTSYEGFAKDIVELVKFERAAAAANDIGDAMSEVLPLLPTDTVVCHIPTAPNRVRVRGYDQAKLIAKRIAKNRKYTHNSLLVRANYTRQVGASREERIRQANEAFMAKKGFKMPEKVLLIDDVSTSGATIEAAASVLKQVGVKTIDAVVFAQAMN